MSRDVQTGSRAQLVRQQQVLSHLGFYKGRIDGIWGPKTIKAKQEFEASGFGPGVPNNGMPFLVKAALPRGLRFEGHMLTCGGFDESKWPESGGLRPRTPPSAEKPQSGSLRNRADRGVVPRPERVRIDLEAAPVHVHHTPKAPNFVDPSSMLAPTVNAEESTAALQDSEAESDDQENVAPPDSSPTGDGEDEPTGDDTAAQAQRAWGKPKR